jgi:hypothetical protein
MSTRRYPGEVVRWHVPPPAMQDPGHDATLIQLTDSRDGRFHGIGPCLSRCTDPHCREWANAKPLFGAHAGECTISHVSECELASLRDVDREYLRTKEAATDGDH